MKVTSWKMSRTLDFVAICGPTYDDADVPPFSWSTADFGNTTNHFGLTDVYQFKPFQTTWAL